MAQGSKKNSSGSRKRWKLEFGLAGMAGLCSVVALIMAWAFILGILVGKGYKPESVISELGQKVPHLGNGPAAPSPSGPSGPLLPEELRFFEILQERAVPTMPAAPPRKEAAQSIQPEPPRAQPTPKPALTTPQPVETIAAEPRFEFVYQVAAFQTDAQARALQQRLTDVSKTTSVEVSVQAGRPWYRVLVTLRGSVADAEQLKARLQAYGLTAPFLRSKKSL
jgi:hypothetical protein